MNTYVDNFRPVQDGGVGFDILGESFTVLAIMTAVPGCYCSLHKPLHHVAHQGFTLRYSTQMLRREDGRTATSRTF